METMLQDLRYGIRMLIKRPGFTGVALLTLALGIGANTAIFSVVNGVLLRSLPYEDPDRLVMVWETSVSRGYDNSGCSPPDFREWRSRSQAFEQMAAFTVVSSNLTGTGEPERLNGAWVSANIFTTLGTSPALGRGFAPEEEVWGQHRVAVISDGFWKRRFGADTGSIGRTISLSGESFTIVGVMPGTFKFPNQNVEVWTPLSFSPGHVLDTRGNHFLNVVARLAAGVTMEQAGSEMRQVALQLEQEYPENAGLGTRVVSLRDEIVGETRPALLVLMAAVGLVLLIACANVANLLLSRAAGRQREIAIRASLGASRGQVVRQLLAESMLLSFLGGTIGLLLALWTVDALVNLAPPDIPRLTEVSLDGRVFGFTFGLSMLTGVAFGLIPAFHATKFDLVDSLKEGGRAVSTGPGGGRTRNALVVAEIALSMVLLISAGLLVKSFMQLQGVDAGFRPANVLTMLISLPLSKYPDARFERRGAFFGELIDRIRSVPGVQSVGAISSLPLSESSWGKLLSIEDRPPAASLDEVPVIQYRQVTPEYFSTLGVPLLNGRFLTESDTRDSLHVALINQTLARRFWPEEDPVGKRIWLGPPEHLVAPLPEDFSFPRYAIIGVVKDVKQLGLGEETPPEIYIHHNQAYRSETSRSMYIAVRTLSEPTDLVAGIRAEVAALDRDQPISSVATMQELLFSSLARPRFNTVLLTLFAAVALLLAAVGVYGVISYSVTRRNHEIGIRIALGAQRSDVLRMVLGQGMGLTLIGAFLGLALAAAATRLIESLLFGVSATDPLVFGSITLLIVLTALAASFVPARRATTVDPIIALRQE